MFRVVVEEPKLIFQSIQDPHSRSSGTLDRGLREARARDGQRQTVCSLLPRVVIAVVVAVARAAHPRETVTGYNPLNPAPAVLDHRFRGTVGHRG